MASLGGEMGWMVCTSTPLFTLKKRLFIQRDPFSLGAFLLQRAPFLFRVGPFSFCGLFSFMGLLFFPGVSFLSCFDDLLSSGVVKEKYARSKESWTAADTCEHIVPESSAFVIKMWIESYIQTSLSCLKSPAHWTWRVLSESGTQALLEGYTTTKYLCATMTIERLALAKLRI